MEIRTVLEVRHHSKCLFYIQKNDFSLSKIATQFGIALPKWIVEGKNSYIVLGAYVLVFMIIMPTIVVSCGVFISIRVSSL